LFRFIGYFVLSLLIFAVTGCTNKDTYTLLQTAKPVKKSTATAASIEYKILPQDRLKVVLYKDPGQITMEGAGKMGEDINPGGILVNAAGYIKLPLIGKIKVAGLTQTQASDKIEKMYKKELTDPSVYVEILNKRLFILGEVHKQGVVKLDKEKMTLFEAIAFAGGLTDDAIRNDIVIISYHPSKGMVMRRVDLTDFDHMRYASLMLRPNDIVYIKPNKWKKFKVASGNYVSPFETIGKIIAPFATLKFLSQ